ncbi:MAG: hypothetical protein GXW85_07840 [Clostridia bacterium]|nr:hypothetical protein [Clostridia bacterium]
MKIGKKTYLTFVILITIVFVLSVIFMGCMKKEDTEKPGTEKEQKQEEKVYVGSEKCYGCHKDIKEQMAENAHGKAFKPLESYNVELDKNIKVYQEVEGGEPKSFDLSQVKVAGVMSDHYVIGSIDNKYFRVAAVESENGKWKLEPAAAADVNKDGTEDWVIKDYTCGNCHSPGLALNLENQENVDPGFSCETCHGPGSVHVTTRAKEAIESGVESCVNCHTSSEPTEKGDILIAQNHYGTRNWFDANHNSGKAEDCLNCHTAHKVNAEGHLIKEASAQELCSSCHGQGVNVKEIMWVNPTDERNHFTKDHSFGKYPYDSYDDDPNTPAVEIRNPETIKEMKSKMKK